MANIIFGWPNRIDQSSLSGGSWQAQLPLYNLLNRQQWKVARSSDAMVESTKFQSNLGALYPLRAIALANHNLSPSAAWRIKIGTTAGASDLYDSAWQAVWAMSFDTDMMAWESTAFWDGVVGDAVTGYPFLAIHVFPDWVSARYVSIEIDDTSNLSGYVQIGRAVICGGFQPQFNVSFGQQDGWEDKTEIIDSEAGHALAVIKRRFRTIRFGLAWNSQDEANIIHEMQRRLGIFGEVLYVPDPADQALSQRYGMLARMTELSAIEYPYPRIRSVGFQLKEL